MDKFQGFDIPKANFSRLPHVFIEEVLPVVDTLAELKCLLYVVRHTWGFSEYGKPKRITMDEFCNGRKRRDGSRIDKGTGMTEPSIRDGLQRATEHGFLLVEVDERDKARVKKYYSLNMKEFTEEQDDAAEYPPEGSGEKVFPPEERSFPPDANLLGSDGKTLDPVQRKKPVRETLDKSNLPLLWKLQHGDAITNEDVTTEENRLKYLLRDEFPEVLQPFADVYVEVTGQEPKKKTLQEWLMTFSEWKSDGYNVDMVRTAYRMTRPNKNPRRNGFAVVRPASLNGTLNELQGLLKIGQPPQFDDDTPAQTLWQGVTVV